MTANCRTLNSTFATKRTVPQMAHQIRKRSPGTSVLFIDNLKFPGACQMAASESAAQKQEDAPWR